MIMYIQPRLGEKLLNCVLISSTRPQFDVWLSRRSQLILARPKLEFGSSHEQLNVLTRSNSAYICILRSDQELACSRGTCVRRRFSSSCMSPDFLLVPDHQIEQGSGVLTVLVLWCLQVPCFFFLNMASWGRCSFNFR